MTERLTIYLLVAVLPCAVLFAAIRFFRWQHRPVTQEAERLLALFINNPTERNHDLAMDFMEFHDVRLGDLDQDLVRDFTDAARRVEASEDECRHTFEVWSPIDTSETCVKCGKTQDCVPQA